MDEIFLDMSNPASASEEARLKAEGYIEKKFTRSTEKEIEGAFKRFLIKKIYPKGSTSPTPANINAMETKLEPMIQEQMYEKKKNGAKVFKFKMFVPSAKLIAKREANEMQMNNNVALYNEHFAPETYGANLEVAHKASKIANNIQHILTKIRTKRTKNNIQKALNKTRKAQNKLEQLQANVKGTPEFMEKVKKAQNNTAKTYRNLEKLYNAEIKPINDISKMLENVRLNTYKVSPINPSSGQLYADETFIESILNIKNTSNNNVLNNGRNRNKLSTKGMVYGFLTTEIKFIRNVVNGLIANGMNTDMAIKMGVILANLSKDQFKQIQSEATKAGGISPQFLLQLVHYLQGVKSR